MLFVLGTPVANETESGPWSVGGSLTARQPTAASGIVARAKEGRCPPEWTHVAILHEPSGSADGFVNALEQAGRAVIEAEPITDKLTSGEPLAACDTIQCLLLSNPKEGAEREFNAWYSGRHLHDVLKVPGYVSAQRFRVGPRDEEAEPHWRYVALYQVAASAYEAAMREVACRAGTPLMPISDAAGPRVSAHFQPFAWWGSR